MQHVLEMSQRAAITLAVDRSRRLAIQILSSSVKNVVLRNSADPGYIVLTICSICCYSEKCSSSVGPWSPAGQRVTTSIS